MSEVAEADKQGMTMGLRQTTHRLGLLLGPLMFGLIASQFKARAIISRQGLFVFRTAAVRYRTRGAA